MFKERVKGILIGMLMGALLVGGVAHALNTTTLENVITGVRIVLDGKEFIPTDANGNQVEPFIYNGTTYLPVRAVSTAMGKAVYWDGPNFTVYLGDTDGKLEYPTVMMTDLTSIAGNPIKSTDLTDNYDNRYNSAVTNGNLLYKYLLNMKYSHFKGTLYVPKGTGFTGQAYLTVEADGKVLYTSPEMTPSSYPVDVDVDVRGCNEITIQWHQVISNSYNFKSKCCLANAGFYQ